MQASKRRAVAYITGRFILHRDSTAIFDYSTSGYFNFSGSVDNSVNVYDNSRSNYLSGDISSLYDYATGQYININVTGTTFSGYDYETGSYFNGTVTDGSINIYDYQDGKYYNYSI
ncbi:hypothetical protein HDC90_004313 [Pedobacter sp. AK013]|uniref:hypothetical protein n=1 Tax=Pedobacter sp. AK013 TaxID=2723071 RepID=UPI00161AF366|nr:hypothetical protein [Pedobacter sp. AK013]MBB6239655.1 hypothetical protein [Pedobacter sp. AK013]